MERVKKFLLNNIGFFFVVLVGLLPLTWFKNGLLIAGGDEYALLDPGALTEYFKYAWNIKLVNEGGVIFSIPKLIPMLYFWTFFKFLGLSLIVVEKLWFIFLFLGPGLSMYYLMSQIYNKNWAKVVSSILYMFSLFVVVAVPFNSNIKPVLIALPLMLALWIKGLNSEKGAYFKYAILIALSSLIFAGSSVNPPSVAPIPIILFIYLIAFILYKRKDYLKIFRFVLVSMVSYLLINFWWIGVFLLSFIEEASSVKNVLSFSAIGYGGIADFFRFLGSWGWKSGHYKMFYYPYAHFYDAPLLLILSFLIPVLSFLAVVLKPKDKKVLFFGLLALMGIFLAKGAAAPFGFIYKWMYENVPFFWTFREPFAKFTPITHFSYSVLIGFTVDTIYQKLKNNKKLNEIKFNLLPNLFPILVITVIFFVAYPLFNGEAIWSYWNGSQRSLHIKVPEYWYEVGDWLRQKNIYSKIFLTPKGSYGLAYNWEQGFSTAETPAVILIDNPTVRAMPEISFADKFIGRLYEKINPDDNNQIVKLLSLLNVKYILQQNDLDWRFAFKDTYSSVQMKSLLQKQEGISFLRSFGKLDLYKIEDGKYLPTVYIPKNNIYTNTGVANYFEIDNLEAKDIRRQIFLENSKIGKDNQEIISTIDSFLLEGELKGRIQEEELGESTSRAVVPATYARNKPGSAIYKILLKKEQLDKFNKRNNPEKLFETHIFYASKRIDEILLYKDSSNYLIDNYKNEIAPVLKILQDFKINKPKDFLSYLIKTEGTIKVHQLKLESLNVGEVEKKKINDTFEDYLYKVNELKPRHDFSNLEYDFDVVKEGEYEVILREADKTINIGKRNFTKGAQKIILPINQMGENLVGSNLKLKEYLPDTLYRITINYKSEGRRGSVSLSEGKLGRLFDVTIPMTKQGDENYKKFEMFFKSSSKTDRAIVNLSVQEFNEFKIEKITQSKLILRSKVSEEKKVPSITLRRVNPTKFIVRVQGATLPYFLVLNESFNKNWKLYFKETSENEFSDSQDNISYFDGKIVEQKGKITFLDRNTFETWGLKPIANDKHFLVNGYANSWLISPKDTNNKEDYEIIIEFGLQRVFYIGIGVSALTLFGFFSYFSYLSYLTITFLIKKFVKK